MLLKANRSCVLGFTCFGGRHFSSFNPTRCIRLISLSKRSQWIKSLERLHLPSSHVLYRSISLFPVLHAAQDPREITDAIETSTQGRWGEDTAQLSDLVAKGDLASLGLGGWGPVGLVQHTLDYLHASAHLPWWVAIAGMTVLLRLVLVPVVVKMQRNAALLNNIRPELEAIQKRLKEFQQTGNKIMVAQETAKMLQLYHKHGCHPLKLIVMPLIQFPLFMSFFFGIRGMAYAPVASMKDGGIFWFTDLTVADPFFVLPVLACCSFLATIELGGEAGVNNPTLDKMKIFFRAMAILLIPVTATFPAGIFMYWLTNSTLSMAQIMLLRVPSVRQTLGIPPIIKYQDMKKPGDENKGVMSKVKDSYQHVSAMDEIKRYERQKKKEYNKLLQLKPEQLLHKPPKKQ